MKPYSVILWGLIAYFLLVCVRPDWGMGTIAFWFFTYRKAEAPDDDD